MVSNSWINKPFGHRGIKKEQTAFLPSAAGLQFVFQFALKIAPEAITRRLTTYIIVA